MHGNAELLSTLKDLEDSVHEAKAKSTSKSYAHWARKFKAFCAENSLRAMPASSLSAALFLKTLANSGLSHSSLAQASAGIKWAHETEMESDPTQSRLISQLLQAERRTAGAAEHKEPATVAHLLEIAEYYEKNKSVQSLRTLVMATVAFAGCLRISDFIDLRVRHVTVSEDSLKLCLPKSKTDQFRSGASTCIRKGPLARICPVTLMRVWMCRPHCLRSQNEPLFPRMTCKSQSIAPIRFREGLRDALAKSNLPKITPHSFRAGFATEACNNGASMSDIKMFGRWESDASVHRYAKRADGNKAMISEKVWGSVSGLVSDIKECAVDDTCAMCWEAWTKEAEEKGEEEFALPLDFFQERTGRRLKRADRC
ncbi:MAG: tyrosine-type recombinase/integrase [Gammaproteobacteria bacterium]|nr:tyrosine-type recombinase/integrase [Gammaproteobacteria bacterium]